MNNKLVAVLMSGVLTTGMIMSPGTSQINRNSVTSTSYFMTANAASLKKQTVTNADKILGKRYRLYLSHTETTWVIKGTKVASSLIQTTVSALGGGALAKNIVKALFAGNTKLMKKADKGKGIIVEFRIINGTNMVQVIDYYTR